MHIERHSGRLNIAILIFWYKKSLFPSKSPEGIMLSTCNLAGTRDVPRPDKSQIFRAIHAFAATQRAMRVFKNLVSCDFYPLPFFMGLSNFFRMLEKPSVLPIYMSVRLNRDKIWLRLIKNLQNLHKSLGECALQTITIEQTRTPTLTLTLTWTRTINSHI